MSRKENTPLIFIFDTHNTTLEKKTLINDNEIRLFQMLTFKLFSLHQKIQLNLFQGM